MKRFFTGMSEQKGFSNKYNNIEYRDSLAETKKLNLIVAILDEYGLEAIVTTHEYVNANIWILILEQVAEHGEKFIIFGDNVSYHTARISRNVYERH